MPVPAHFRQTGGKMNGLSEIVPVQDIFCSGLGAIEKLEGGNFRIYLYVTQGGDVGQPREKILVAKIIAPASAIPDAVFQMIAAISGRTAGMIPVATELVH
jgi:hypothetical protein